ncbi:MAG: Asp-tRNA(Asn)/Glu-tRNA(Gln) amidotransferase subunit GatA [Longimicrobiales bacterium]
MSGRIARLAARVASGEITAEKRIRASFDRLQTGESGPDRINAFISFDYDGTIAQAMQVDESAVLRAGALAGVPIAIKDNICTIDAPTTCAARIMSNYRSPYDATVVRRLRAAGAVMVGKTNLDEFAMGSSTEYSAFGPTRNPRNLEHVPGGSSGGSAAAVAAGFAEAALGTETSGSVRQPAAFCGVVGVRPTYGRVSRYGVIAFASSLDQVGPIAQNVEDAALLLQVIAGADPFDATTVDVSVPDFRALLGDGVHGLVIGVPREYQPRGIDPAVARACTEAIGLLRERGAIIREMSLPHTALALPAYHAIASIELCSNLGRFDGVRFGARVEGSTPAQLMALSRGRGFGAETKRRILMGTHILQETDPALRIGARRARAMVTKDFDDAWGQGIDLLFTATTHAPAFRLGAELEPYEMYMSDMLTVGAALAGIPAMSIPIGATHGLPIGGQLMAPRWQEPLMFRAAAALESALL